MQRGSRRFLIETCALEQSLSLSTGLGPSDEREPFNGVSISRFSALQMLLRYLAGQIAFILRKETPSSRGLIITYEPFGAGRVRELERSFRP